MKKIGIRVVILNHTSTDYKEAKENDQTVNFILVGGVGEMPDYLSKKIQMQHIDDEIKIENWELLNEGTHLVSTRGFYTHHGIYVGNQEVIHYAGLSDELKKDKVCKTSLSNFKGNGSLYFYHKSKTFKDLFQGHKEFERSEIVQRAYSRLNENTYHVAFNNCEHFANWCTHGEHKSKQVENVRDALISSAVSLATSPLVGTALISVPVHFITKNVLSERKAKRTVRKVMKKAFKKD